jgi:phosphonate transport system substrate-binding protein
VRAPGTARRNRWPAVIIRLCGSIGLTVVLAATSFAGQDGAGHSAVTRFRLGTTPATFGSMSSNDTKAAITAWAKNLLLPDSISIGTDIVTVFEKVDELLNAYEDRQLDGVTLAALDFPKVRSRPGDVILMYKNHSVATRYAVLVQRSSGIEDIRQLKGRKVVIHSGSQMIMATPWIDTLLASRSMGLSQNAFGAITRIDSASKAILQVFFRQADACVVALDAFHTASELNPQVEKELKPLIVSPELISTFFFFHPEYNLKDKKAVEAAINDLDRSPAGQQVLTVFQSEKLVKKPVSILDDTIALVAEHERIKRSDATGAKHPQLSQTSIPRKN